MSALLMPWFPLLKNERKVSSIPSALYISHLHIALIMNFYGVYEPLKIVILYIWCLYLCVCMWFSREILDAEYQKKSHRIVQNSLIDSKIGQFSKAQFLGEGWVFNGEQNSHFAPLLLCYFVLTQSKMISFYKVSPMSF